VMACLVVLSAARSWADGIADGTKTAASLASKITYVATGGIWERDGRFGRYRLIVVTEGVEHAGTYVYAQWLSIEESTHEIEVVATEPIDSINNRFASVVQNVRFDYTRSKSGTGVFELTFSERIPEEEARATVTLGKPGEFDVEVQR
jgi:hypothetical protein